MSLLQMGSRGPQVATLQRALNEKMFPSPNLSTDGVFGMNTKNAVMQFQQRNGLQADGVVGPRTQAALANARPAAPTGQSMRMGSRGDGVKEVQQLLNQKLFPNPGLVADGVFGQKTHNAVVAFQRSQGLTTDGIVGPQTLNALRHAQATPQPQPANPTNPGSNDEVFPFTTVTSYNWAESYRAFGSNRSGGRRAHAGCDLYYPTGTKIYAVRAGTVTRGPYEFYASTWAIEIDHGSFVARYGEVQGNTQVKAGDTVVAGQHIAQVGHLVGISVPSDMLHFEMYSGAASGSLTDKSSSAAKRADGVSYQRRSDLMDPTPYLNQWQSHLPR